MEKNGNQKFTFSLIIERQKKIFNRDSIYRHMT